MPYVLAKHLDNLMSGKHQQSRARDSGSSRGSIGGGGVGGGGSGSDSFILRRSKGRTWARLILWAIVTYSFSSLIYSMKLIGSGLIDRYD